MTDITITNQTKGDIHVAYYTSPATRNQPLLLPSQKSWNVKNVESLGHLSIYVPGKEVYTTQWDKEHRGLNYMVTEESISVYLGIALSTAFEAQPPIETLQISLKGKLHQCTSSKEGDSTKLVCHPL